LSEYEAWEIIPNNVLLEVDKQAQTRVKKLIQQDQAVVWCATSSSIPAFRGADLCSQEEAVLGA